MSAMTLRAFVLGRVERSLAASALLLMNGRDRGTRWGATCDRSHADAALLRNGGGIEESRMRGQPLLEMLLAKRRLDKMPLTQPAMVGGSLPPQTHVTTRSNRALKNILGQ